jgi:ABC-2 type transport system ATP-binding protein
MMNVLELKDVSKNFGSLNVLQRLSFAVPQGSVFGFIGKNGAGKTTTMKMILGFLPVSGGDIKVCGEPVTFGATRTNRHIGYLPDVPEFYSYMRPKEYMRLCGQVIGLKPAQLSRQTEELLGLVGLDGVNRKISGFSRGMKQRLGIAQALIGSPKLLICDEPTSALDPVGRKEILDILHRIKSRTTIVFSTHILSDVERICDTIGILDKGRLALEGRLEDIRSTYRQDGVRVELTSEADAGRIAQKLSVLPGIARTETAENAVTVHFRTAGSGADVLAAVAAERLPVLRYEILEPELENVFLEVIQ